MPQPPTTLPAPRLTLCCLETWLDTCLPGQTSWRWADTPVLYSNVHQHRVKWCWNTAVDLCCCWRVRALLHWLNSSVLASKLQRMKTLSHLLPRSLTTMLNGIWKTSILWMTTQTFCMVGRIFTTCLNCFSLTNNSVNNIYCASMFFCPSTKACSCWHISFKIKGETTEEKVGFFSFVLKQ